MSCQRSAASAQAQAVALLWRRACIVRLSRLRQRCQRSRPVLGWLTGVSRDDRHVV
jgi:hypothetical protein